MKDTDSPLGGAHGCIRVTCRMTLWADSDAPVLLFGRIRILPSKTTSRYRRFGPPAVGAGSSAGPGGRQAAEQSGDSEARSLAWHRLTCCGPACCASLNAVLPGDGHCARLRLVARRSELVSLHGGWGKLRSRNRCCQSATGLRPRRRRGRHRRRTAPRGWPSPGLQWPAVSQPLVGSRVAPRGL